MLTKLEVQQLKHADVISFHYDRVRGHIIRATKKGQDNFDQLEWEAEIRVNGAFTIYSDYRTGISWQYKVDVNTAFEMIYTPAYTEYWQTVIANIREGDIITLRWIAGNNSEYLINVGLTKDELELWIDRKGKRYVYRIAQSITPPTSRARMIRHNGRL